MMQKFEAPAGEPLKIPKEVMSQFKYKLVAGENTGFPLTIFCRSYAWDGRANRWRLNYALVANYEQSRGEPPVKRATLYKTAAIIGHAMIMIPLTQYDKTEASNG